jgi:hypothetical protein
MAKGDHVFNNVVSKLNGAFEAGFIAYARAKLATEEGSQVSLNSSVHSREAREEWMQRHMPRTLRLLADFRNDIALKDVRERLQTATHQGLDANNAAYSVHAQEFQEAVVRLFTKIARTRSYTSEGELLPEIRRVRRAFFHMTHTAEDPGALRRLLDQYDSNERDLAKLEASITDVRDSLGVAWGRCERIFRMAAAELLRLST